ncbi:MAG: cyclic pyranopterin phosphate synthase MoaA [Deltaproteobacteria bacterium RBG_13_49_15]|nr:MAG: cyclic pyranopterin phosphate synthase MoaA [Deltaproteobacteria bacterium RBG_13_49_15]
MDRFNRRLNYLRVSITDRCNLRCNYCTPAGFFPKLPHKEILSYEEILRLVRLLVCAGVSKVRITGGEPLVRKGVYEFLSELHRIEALSDISLTTNGVLLKENIRRIKSAGINRINVSLDSLNREKYGKIAGADRFDEVWEGIQLSLLMGFDPVKINMVAIKGVNDDELIDFARLSLIYPFHVRFIEYMPIGTQCMSMERQMLAPEIKQKIEEIGSLHPISRGANDGPAERFRFDGAPGEIGFIRPISRHFCPDCNRLRLTASGQLRLCLLSNLQFDLKTPIRTGASDSELLNMIFSAADRKPLEHELVCREKSTVLDPMYAIGG